MLHTVLPDLLLQIVNNCNVNILVCASTNLKELPLGILGDCCQWGKYVYNEISNYIRELSSSSLTKQMHYLFLSGMNLVRLSSLAGLLLRSAFWEVPYFAAPAPEKHLTQHHGPIPRLHLPVGKTTCDTEAKQDNPGKNRKWTLKYYDWL